MYVHEEEGKRSHEFEILPLGMIEEQVIGKGLNVVVGVRTHKAFVSSRHVPGDTHVIYELKAVFLSYPGSQS